MDNPRRYGAPPYTVAVIHGGPGAPGSVAPVARALADRWGVLEPLQTANTIAGQVAELAGVVAEHATVPATLVGHSWGAWLSLLVAAEHPALVRKLVLIGSGPFTADHAAGIAATREARLPPAERERAAALIVALNAAPASPPSASPLPRPSAGAGPEPAAPDRDALLAELGSVLACADACEPDESLSPEPEPLPVDGAIFERVWGEASALRASGELLARAARVRCPVVALHGDYDPHPVAGVALPLGAVLAPFQLVLLRRCGHEPWIERHARDAFYRALLRELE